MPRACALASMSRNIGSGGPAKLILTMRAFLLAAQSRPLRILKVVPCALSLSPEKARTASSFTFGATPMSLECAAMAPAMPVPCICAGDDVPSASYWSAITPARSGWLESILESITATRTSSPLVMRWASTRCSLGTTYCAAEGSLCDAEPAAAGSASQSEPSAAQYVVPKLHLVEAHRITNGDDVLVAVIDSKIDSSHPDLAGVIADQYDALGTSSPAHMHGTGMAGAIAAHSRLIGVAPKVKLLAVRAFSGDKDSAQGTTFNILKGLDWAASKNARIVNMSFAGPPDPMFRDMLTKAHVRGIVLIAAVGNAGPRSPPLYPAADPDVIGVTATDAEDRLFPQANRGPQVAVAAPGVQVLEPAPDATYQVTTGTSVAAAHASGVAALLLAWAA